MENRTSRSEETWLTHQDQGKASTMQEIQAKTCRFDVAGRILFEFRIHNVGKVYVTGFTDDCSGYRISSKAYLRKRKEESVNALQCVLRKRRTPREMYLDNGKQFIAKLFKQEVKKHDIKLICGKPYNPRGRGETESYHKALYRELIFIKEFKIILAFQEGIMEVR